MTRAVGDAAAALHDTVDLDEDDPADEPSPGARLAHIVSLHKIGKTAALAIVELCMAVCTEALEVSSSDLPEALRAELTAAAQAARDE